MNLKKTMVGALAGASLLIGSQAFAASFSYTDLFDPTDFKLSEGQSFTHEHNVNAGYNAATDTITSAEFKFWLYDDGDSDSGRGAQLEFVSYQYNEGFGWLLSDGGEVDGTVGSPSVFNLDVLNTWLFSDIWALNDGKLSYTMKATDGDFYFAKSTLTINGTRVASVPEPTTLALFAAGLLGLGFGMRRKQSC